MTPISIDFSFFFSLFSGVRYGLLLAGKRLGLPSALFRSSTRLPNELDTTSVRAELINGLLLIKACKKHGC